jgi:ribosomal protein S18 acetylase RimI-like enzyme
MEKGKPMVTFKQFIIESTLDIQLKKLGLRRGGYGYKVGKAIGGCVYVHRQYEDQFPKEDLERAKINLPPDYDYTVVKYNTSNAQISFLRAFDWDSNPEPIIDDYYDSQGKFKRCGTVVYHHKWEFVADDYQGFDVEKSKRRSLEWTSLDGVDKSRIGSAKFWNDNVVPRLIKEIVSNETLKNFLDLTHPYISDEKIKWLSSTIQIRWDKFGSYRFMKIIDGEQPIGVIQVMSQKKGIGHVSNVFVLPEYRRKGIGRELMIYVKKLFPKLTFSTDRSENGEAFISSIQ